MKKYLLLCFTLLCIFFLNACASNNNSNSSTVDTHHVTTIASENTAEMDFSIDETDRQADFNPDTTITLSRTEATIQGFGVKETDNTLTIQSKGTYLFSGIYEKQLRIDAGNDDVTIVLDQVQITSQDGPAIYVRSAAKVFIILPPNTHSTLSDTRQSSEDAVEAALYCKTDLVIKGSGTLSVNGTNKNGIVSKNNLTICTSHVNVTSANIGLSGKDSVKLSDATVDIKSGGDGIRTSNDKDHRLGFVFADQSILTIDAGNDGVQAETALYLHQSESMIKAGVSNTSYTNDGSYKGLKAGSDILINGGSYTFRTMDDSIHSDANIFITNGTIDITSAKKGLHADHKLSISDGLITVHDSMEGLEGFVVNIFGGHLEITSQDDGINASSKSSTASKDNQSGGKKAQDGEINISGGYIYINARGDGIDSNGEVNISGGIVLTNGPSDHANASFDYDTTATITGGLFISLGSSGMAQSFTDSTQGTILCVFEGTDKSLSLVDDHGSVIISLNSPRKYNCALISAPSITTGNTYSLRVGASVSNADSHGFASDSTYKDGEEIYQIHMDSLQYTSSGFHGKGF